MRDVRHERHCGQRTRKREADDDGGSRELGKVLGDPSEVKYGRGGVPDAVRRREKREAVRDEEAELGVDAVGEPRPVGELGAFDEPCGESEVEEEHEAEVPQDDREAPQREGLGNDGQAHLGAKSQGACRSWDAWRREAPRLRLHQPCQPLKRQV